MKNAYTQNKRDTREACKTSVAKGEMKTSNYHLHLLPHTARHNHDRVDLKSVLGHIGLYAFVAKQHLMQSKLIPLSCPQDNAILLVLILYCFHSFLASLSLFIFLAQLLLLI